MKEMNTTKSEIIKLFDKLDEQLHIFLEEAKKNGGTRAYKINSIIEQQKIVKEKFKKY